MQYRDDLGNRYFIWNSRDGVTPFIVHCNGRMAEHVNFAEDQRIPDYDPPIDSYVFVDLTHELALERRQRYVEKYWDVGDVPLSSYFPNKETAVRELVTHDVQPGAPCLMKVDDGLLQWIRKQRDMRNAKKGE